MAQEKSKYLRTTREQLEYFINFVKENPKILHNKNDPSNPKRIQNLWARVAENLNGLKGLTRSIPKWKETLSHWKHQLRSRARKSKAYKKVTGGGPPILDEMDSFDKKALEIFGSIAVEGLSSISTLGIQEKENCNEIFSNSSPDVEETENIFSDTENLPETFDSHNNSLLLTAESSSTTTPVQKKRKSTNTSEDELITKIMNDMKERDERKKNFRKII